MNINYRKFLPSTIQDGRWGEFIEAFQNLIENDIKPNSIDVIELAKRVDSMTIEQVILACSFFGKTLNMYDGYTNTLDYGKKILSTMVLKIINKTTRKAYQYVLYSYNIKGDVFPIYKNTSGMFVANRWWSEEEKEIATQYLDEGWFLDQPDSGFEALDKTSIVDELTRHIIVKYFPLFIEYNDNTTYMNEFSVGNFHSDLLETKRKTEVLYIEPTIRVFANKDFTTFTKILTDFEGNNPTQEKSILIKDELKKFSKIRFGNSSHSIIDNTIIDVDNFQLELTSANIFIEEQEYDSLIFRKKLVQKPKFRNFENNIFSITEVAIFNDLDECILYSTFPKVEFIKQAYSNVSLNIKLL